MTNNQRRETVGRDKIFKLFHKGYGPNSPEVKELGLAYDTRKGYYWEWVKLDKPDGYTKAESPTPESKIRKGGVKLDVKEIRDYKAGVVEPEKPPEPPEGAPEPVPEPVPEVEQPSGEGKPPEKPPEKPEPERKKSLVPAIGEAMRESFEGLKVAGSTLPFVVDLSAKTIALYDIAATEAGARGESLDMGQFIDTCVEDYYLGRGLDLGLITIKKEGGGDGKG